MKDDLKVWYDFLKNFNGRSLLSFRDTETSDSLHMFTDSSKSRYGGTFLDQYIVGIFPPSWQSHDIQFLELHPIFILITLFAHKLSHSHITFHTLNQAVASIIKVGSTLSVMCATFTEHALVKCKITSVTHDIVI